MSSLFILEEIVNHQIKRGQLLYLVKWKGFGDDGNTWEGEKNVENYVDAIEKYWHKSGAKPRSGNHAAEARPDEPSTSISKTPAKPIKTLRSLYNIEHIVDHKEEGGRMFYLIKWEGYDHDENTWEPSSHLVKCADDIKIYWQNRDTTETQQPKPSTSTRMEPSPSPSHSFGSVCRDEKNKCVICHKKDMDFDMDLVGPMMTDFSHTIAVHFNCLLYSPVLIRDTRYPASNSGILGYSLRQIRKEAERARKLVSHLIIF